MTDDTTLRPHYAKIEGRLIAEAQRIRQELEDQIDRVRKTITTFTPQDTPVIPASDGARLRLVWSSKKRAADPLYWSMDGSVACASHAPRPADPRYRSEEWRPVLQGRWYLQCQFCHGTSIRPATRGARSHQ